MSSDNEDNVSITNDGNIAGDTLADVTTLQGYCEDDSKVLPSDRMRFHMTLCLEYLDNFSTDVEPYSHTLFNKKKKQFKSYNPFLKKEVMRRFPSTKYVDKMSRAKLQTLLKSEELPPEDLEYLRSCEATYRASCEESIKEHNLQRSSPGDGGNVAAARITTDDRLRLIEALLSDKAKPHMVTSQEILSHQQLDARNSVARDKDYFEIVADVFNDLDYTPTLVPAPSLHPEFELSRELPLKEYRVTCSKVKDIHDSMKNKLLTIIKAWEQSGNGAGQRDASFGEDEWVTSIRRRWPVTIVCSSFATRMSTTCYISGIALMRKVSLRKP